MFGKFLEKMDHLAEVLLKGNWGTDPSVRSDKAFFNVLLPAPEFEYRFCQGVRYGLP